MAGKRALQCCPSGQTCGLCSVPCPCCRACRGSRTAASSGVLTIRCAYLQHTHVGHPAASMVNVPAALRTITTKVQLKRAQHVESRGPAAPASWRCLCPDNSPMQDAVLSFWIQPHSAPRALAAPLPPRCTTPARTPQCKPAPPSSCRGFRPPAPAPELRGPGHPQALGSRASGEGLEATKQPCQHQGPCRLDRRSGGHAC